MKWLENLTWQKLILIIFVILIVLMLFRPDVAQWALDAISSMTSSVMDALNLGG